MIGGSAIAQSISETDAIAIYKSFLSRACFGITDSAIDPPIWRDDSVRVELPPSGSRRKIYSLFTNAGYGGVTFKGKVISANMNRVPSLPTSWNNSRAIRPDQCLEALQIVYSAAGFSHQLQLESCFRQEDWYYDQCFEVNAHPVYRGVRFWDGPVNAKVEHTTGRIMHFSVADDDLPTPPTSVTPYISIQEARVSAFEFLRERAGVQRPYDQGGWGLCIWRIRNHNYFNDFTQIERDKQAANEGLLVYRLVILNLDKCASDLSWLGELFIVYVSPEDGHILTVEESGAKYAFGGGTIPPPRFGWDVSHKDALVTINKKSVYKGPIDIAFVKRTVDKPFTGKQVLISAGKRGIVALFDKKSGLLCAKARDRYAVGRPNKELLLALRSAIK